MDGACDDLLAGAAFAVDQHGGGGRRHALDHFADVKHRGAGGDEVLEPVAQRHLGLLRDDDRVVLDARLGSLDGRQHLVDLEGLGYVVEGAAFHRVDRRLDGGIGGEQDHGKLRLEGLDRADQLQPVHRRHPQIRDDQVDSAFADDLERLVAVLGRHGLVSVGLEKTLQEDQNPNLVVHYQYFSHLGAHPCKIREYA